MKQNGAGGNAGSTQYPEGYGPHGKGCRCHLENPELRLSLHAVISSSEGLEHAYRSHNPGSMLVAAMATDADGRLAYESRKPFNTNRPFVTFGAGDRTEMVMLFGGAIAHAQSSDMLAEAVGYYNTYYAPASGDYLAMVREPRPGEEGLVITAVRPVVDDRPAGNGEPN
jgi:hypothetical protein